MPSKITCVVIEDEEQILASVCEILASFPEIEIVGTAVGVESGYKLIRDKKPDAAFLDVLIQGGDIFHVIDRLKKNHSKMPISVILSGRPEYAIQAFNYRNCFCKFLTKAETIDSKTKFREAVDTIIYEKSKLDNSKKPKDHFFIHQRNDYFRVECDEVFYIETGEKAAGTINIICRDRKIPVGTTLSTFLRNYPLPDFQQIARQRAVNVTKIKEVNTTDSTAYVYINGEKIELGIGSSFMQRLLIRLKSIFSKTF